MVNRSHYITQLRSGSSPAGATTTNTKQQQNRMETNFIQQHVIEIQRNMEKKREDFVKEKMREKGYFYAAENFGKVRFPNVMAEMNGEWLNFYGDNNTPEGEFIIAVSNVYLVQNNDLWSPDLNFKLAFNHSDVPASGKAESPNISRTNGR